MAPPRPAGQGRRRDDRPQADHPGRSRRPAPALQGRDEGRGRPPDRGRRRRQAPRARRPVAQPGLPRCGPAQRRLGTGRPALPGSLGTRRRAGRAQVRRRRRRRAGPPHGNRSRRGGAGRGRAPPEGRHQRRHARPEGQVSGPRAGHPDLRERLRRLGGGSAWTAATVRSSSSCTPTSWVAADRVFNQIGKARHMFGGDIDVPFVLRTKVAMGTGYGSQHSMDPAGIFATAPGWRIVAPSTPYDYVGLMNTALASKDPVLVIEHVDLYGSSGEVPAGDLDYAIPFARQVPPGRQGHHPDLPVHGQPRSRPPRPPAWTPRSSTCARWTAPAWTGHHRRASRRPTTC